MRKVIGYYILIIGLIACNKTNDNKANDRMSTICDSSIDSITVSYYNQYFESPLARKYSDIMTAKRPTFEKIYIANSGDYNVLYTGVIDTVIANCSVLLSIESELNTLKPDTSFAVKDFRIALIVYYKDSKLPKKVLINESNDVFLNNILQIKNNKFIYLIKKNIGFYSWFTRDYLEDMEELNDTTFEREPNLMSAEKNPRLIGAKNIFQ